MNLNTIERRVGKLENQGVMQRHIIIVQFVGDDDPGPLNMASCRGEVFARKPDEPHEDFLNRAAGEEQGVVVMFAIDARRPAKHPLANSIYLAGYA